MVISWIKESEIPVYITGKLNLPSGNQIKDQTLNYISKKDMIKKIKKNVELMI
jgi:hypothetical protein